MTLHFIRHSSPSSISALSSSYFGLYLRLRSFRLRLYLSAKLLDLLLYNHSLIYSYKVRYFEVTTSLLPNCSFSTLDSFVVLNLETHH